MLIVALLYYATPNVKQPKFRWISVGAAVAIVIWMLAAAGFAFYVANFASYNKTYGSLAGVVVGLIFLWLTNVALLLGAEIDSELERGRQLQAGIAAETRDPAAGARHPQHREGGEEGGQEDAAKGRRIRRGRAGVAVQTDNHRDRPSRGEHHEEADLVGRLRPGLRARRARRAASATSRSRTPRSGQGRPARPVRGLDGRRDRQGAGAGRGQEGHPRGRVAASAAAAHSPFGSSDDNRDELLDQLDPESTARQDDPYPKGDLP